MRDRRSIDLAAAHALIPETKLPTNVKPTCGGLEIRPDLEKNSFSGNVKHYVTIVEDTNKISLHAHPELEIEDADVKVSEVNEK